MINLPEDLPLSRPEGRPVSRPGFFLPEDLQVSRPVFSLCTKNLCYELICVTTQKTFQATYS